MENTEESNKPRRSKRKKELIRGEDYYFDQNGKWTFTAKYLTDRGYCCGNRCRHCPY